MYYTVNEYTGLASDGVMGQNLLSVVFENGALLRDMTLADVRRNAALPIVATAQPALTYPGKLTV